MLKIIDEILKEVPSDEMLIQVKEICNVIQKEEAPTIKYPQVLPDGANIFLALEVPAKNKGEISFLTIERDPMDEYISHYYSIKITDIRNTTDLPQMPKRYQSHRIEGRSAKKIMIEFAKLVKFYRGE
jgi:hypothetical protein